MAAASQRFRRTSARAGVRSSSRPMRGQTCSRSRRGGAPSSPSSRDAPTCRWPLTRAPPRPSCRR
eukprot:526627-Alexandrium_andersonii.AAC.1